MGDRIISADRSADGFGMKEHLAFAFSICGNKLSFRFKDASRPWVEVDIGSLPFPADYRPRADGFARESAVYDLAWQYYCKWCCLLVDDEGVVRAVRLSAEVPHV